MNNFNEKIKQEDLFKDFLDYNHPEYYNFNTFEGMIDILDDFIKRTFKITR